jgi:hypothetical protein
MKSFRLAPIFFATVLGLCFFATTPVFGSAKKDTPPPPVDTRKLIKAIDAANSTVDIENMREKTVHTYKIDDVTVVKEGNMAIKFADIKVGMKVTDELERDNDTLDSITVEIDNTPKPDPKKKK